MKKFKNVLISILIFSFLFLNVPQIEMVEAGNDVYPVEVVTPDQPLTEGEEVDFYIIVNDKNLRSEISRFVFYLHSNDKTPMEISYDGESHIKLTFKMPSLTYSEHLMTTLEVYSKTEEKFILKIYKNVQYRLKYPMGSLPEQFNAEAQEQIAKTDFDIARLSASHEYEGEKTMVKVFSEMKPWNRYPKSSSYFNVNDEDYVTNEEVEESIKKRILDAPDTVDKSYYHDVSAVTDSEEINSADSIIKKILLVNASIFQVMAGGSIGERQMPSTVYYDLQSSVDVFIKSERNDEANRSYTFIFRKSAKDISLDNYENEMEEFKKGVRDFAKNIIMHKFQNNDFEDLEQSMHVSNFVYPELFPEYNMDNLVHSEIYNEILAGGEPGVEKLVREKKKMEDREFKISFKFDNEATIWNTGIVNTGTDKDTSFSIAVNIDGKAFDKDKKEIEVSDEELYKDVYLIYEIINPKSQITFYEADIGDNKLKIKVDDVLEIQYLQSIGPILYTGPYLPTEYVAVYLVDKSENLISGRFIYKVHMKDASPRIEMKKSIVEIDDVADSIFEFRIVDEFHDKVECFVKIPYEKYQKNKVPFIKVSKEGQGEVSTQIQPFECETNKWISIRVRPPKLSNFNMLDELNGLNMWDLQRGTMETFAVDLVGFAVDRRMINLKKSKQALTGLYEKGYTGAKGVFTRAEKIEKTMRYLDKANGLAGDAQNAIKLTQVGDNIDSHIKDIKNASGAEKLTDFLGSSATMGESGASIVESTAADMKKTSENGSKTSLEAGYDWGIAGINILQSTVGVIAMAPGHIPFVGKYAKKVTGTFSIVFNLMTNVWKGNLEYLSKEKKLDRAQEKSLPYPVMVGVSTKEGFRDVDAQIISVLYNYLEN